jgi:5'-3' exonuclease
LGSSSWHLNIHKGYKAHRRSDDLYGLSRERIHLYFKILQQNYLLIESLCRRIPNVYISCLEHFEADFVPYYLIRNKLVDIGSDICHLIYSNDKDLHQILKLNPHVYQLARKLKTFHVVRKDRVMSFFLKRESSLPDEYFSIALAIQGDDGDEVPGIKGVGPASINKVMEYVIKMGNSVEEILDNAFNDKPLFHKLETSPINNVNKLLELIYNQEQEYKVITRNLKLIDFEILSRVLDEYPKLEYREKAKKLRASVLDKEVEKLDILKKAIDRSRIYFEEGALDILYS